MITGTTQDTECSKQTLRPHAFRYSITSMTKQQRCRVRGTSELLADGILVYTSGLPETACLALPLEQGQNVALKPEQKPSRTTLEEHACSGRETHLSHGALHVADDGTALLVINELNTDLPVHARHTQERVMQIRSGCTTKAQPYHAPESRYQCYQCGPSPWTRVQASQVAPDMANNSNVSEP